MFLGDTNVELVNFEEESLLDDTVSSNWDHVRDDSTLLSMFDSQGELFMLDVVSMDTDSYADNSETAESSLS